MNRYQGNDAKRHYKMFKSGKHWAFMAITTVSIAGGLGFAQTSTTHAAENTATATAQVSQTSTAPDDAAKPASPATETAKTADAPATTTTTKVTSATATATAATDGDPTSDGQSSDSATTSDDSSTDSRATDDGDDSTSKDNSSATTGDASTSTDGSTTTTDDNGKDGSASTTTSDSGKAAGSSTTTGDDSKDDDWDLSSITKLISSVGPTFVKAQVQTALKDKADTATATELSDKIAKLVSTDDGAIDMTKMAVLAAQAGQATGSTSSLNIGAIEKDLDLILGGFEDASGKVDQAKADAALASISDANGHLDTTKTAAFLKTLSANAGTTSTSSTDPTDKGAASTATDTDPSGKSDDSDTDDSTITTPDGKYTYVAEGKNSAGLEVQYVYDFSKTSGTSLTSSTQKLLAEMPLSGAITYAFPNQNKDTDLRNKLADQVMSMFMNDDGQFVPTPAHNFETSIFKTDLKPSVWEDADGNFDQTKWDTFIAAITDKNGRFDHEKYTDYVVAQTGKQDTWYAYTQNVTDPGLQYLAETKQTDPNTWVNPNLAVKDPTNGVYVDDLKHADFGATLVEPTDHFATTAMATHESTPGNYNQQTGLVTFQDGSYYDTKTNTMTIVNPNASKDDRANQYDSQILLGVYKDRESTLESGTYNPDNGLIEFSNGSYYIPDQHTMVFSNDAINNGASYKVVNYLTGEALDRGGVYYTSGQGWFSNVKIDTDSMSVFLLKVHKEFKQIDPNNQKLTDMIDSYYQQHLDELGHPKESPIIALIYGVADIMVKMKNSNDEEIHQFFGNGQLPYTVSFLEGTDAFKAWENHYDGTGTVVAVIDNGLEPVNDMRLDDDSKAAIQKSDAQAFIDQKGYGTYINSKIPFAYNYVDNDSDSTGTYQVDHGMHVSGIIAANGEQPELTPEQKALAALGNADGSGSLVTQFSGIMTDFLTTGKLDKDALDKLVGDLQGKLTDPSESQNLVATILGLFKKDDNDSDADGTEVIGTADAETSGSKKYAVGIAPNAQILDLRVISNTGSGEAAMISKAIHDAVDLGADAINMSIGETYINQDDKNTEEEAIKYAFDHGVIVNISASNSNTRANTSTGGGQAYTPENYSQLSNPATSPYAISVAASGDLSVENQMKSMMGLDSGVGMVAQFSSWGPNSDFSLKPDITAPGVNLDSLEYEEQDQQMSGTSMSSPASTGITDLVEQRLKEMGFSGAKLAEYTKLAEMNSAIIITNENTGNVYSPRQQGAGLADAGLATSATVAVEGDADTGSVSLKNIGQSTNITLHFTNYGDHDVTYTFSPDQYTVLKNVWDTDANGKLVGNGVSHDEALKDASVTMANNKFTIKAGQSQDITLTLKIGDSVAKDQIVEGYLRFASDEADGTNNVSVPYLAFYGDLTHENVFDLSGAGYTSYLSDPDSQLPLGIGSNAEAVKVFVDQAASNFANGYSDQGDDAKNVKGVVADADAFKASISPNNDKEDDSVTPVVYLTQNLKTITAEILDAKGNVVRVLDHETNLDASGVNATASGLGYSTLDQSYEMAYDHPEALTWDGTLYDQTTGKYVAAADGKYTYRIIGTLNYAGDDQTQTKDFGLTVDTKAPTFTPQFDAANDTIAFSYQDQGIGFTDDSLLIYTIGGKDYETSLGNDGTKNDGHFSYKLTTDEANALKASDGKLTLAIHDAAGNVATATLTTGIGTGKATTNKADGEKETAPIFQFYLDSGQVLDSVDGSNSNDDLSGLSAVNLADFGFTVDTVSTPLYQGKTDTAILKAKVTGAAGTQYFVKNEITGQVYTPYAFDKDGNALFKVDGIKHAEDLMINLGAALFTGYAITPTAQAGVYKESLIDSILLSDTSLSETSSSADDFTTTFLNSKYVSPFTDTKYLTNLIHSYDQDDGTNDDTNNGWDPTDVEIGYEDSHQDDFLLPQLDYRTNNQWREKGHTIDTNHTTIDNGTNDGSDYDYKMPKQDVLTMDPKAETILNKDTKDPNFDQATDTYTITGKINTTGYSEVEEAKFTNPTLYILGNSSYEDDPANKVTINKDGSFSYKVKLDNDSNRAIGYILIYQLTNPDGTTGELRVFKDILLFYTDQDDPTLAVDVAGLDTGKPTEDGTYKTQTDKSTFDLSATVNDNADNYTLTVNGNQIFRQANQGEPHNETKTNVFGDYTYNGAIALKLGQNVITLKATDQNGKTVTKTIEVTRTAVDATSAPATKSDQDAGYEAGYREGATGAQLNKDLSGKTAEFITGFAAGYNAGAATRNAKLAAQLNAEKAATGKSATVAKAAPATKNLATKATSASSADKQTQGDAFPQTGEQAQPSVLGLLGATLLASIAGAFGFGKRRHQG